MAVEAVVEAGEEVVVRAEVNLIIIIEEVVRIKVRVQAEVRIKIRIVIIRVRARTMEDTPGIRPQGTQTCPLSSPVSGTGHMGSQLIFVWSLAPAPGSSIGYPSQIINEIRLNSHKRGQSLFTVHYQTDFQK